MIFGKLNQLERGSLQADSVGEFEDFVESKFLMLLLLLLLSTLRELVSNSKLDLREGSRFVELSAIPSIARLFNQTHSC